MSPHFTEFPLRRRVGLGGLLHAQPTNPECESRTSSRSMDYELKISTRLRSASYVFYYSSSISSTERHSCN